MALDAPKATTAYTLALWSITMTIDPSDLQSEAAQAYWRKVFDLPPDTPIFCAQAIRRKFFGKSKVEPDLLYDKPQPQEPLPPPRDIVQCLCGVVVIRSQDGQVNWSNGLPHTCRPPKPPVPKSTKIEDSRTDWIV